MNAPRQGLAFGADQVGKREYLAWIAHAGKRHRLGIFDRRPEALRIAKGVHRSLHQRTRIIAGKDQNGPFPTWQDKAIPTKSIDPGFAPQQVIENTRVLEPENGGVCTLGPTAWVHAHGAVYAADRKCWRAWVRADRRRRWVGRFATKVEAETAARAAADGAP